jgi:hypothetical protein
MTGMEIRQKSTGMKLLGLTMMVALLSACANNPPQVQGVNYSAPDGLILLDEDKRIEAIDGSWVANPNEPVMGAGECGFRYGYGQLRIRCGDVLVRER